MKKGIITDMAKIELMSAGAILADPPWDWSSYSRKGEGRSAKAHYDVMSLVDIKQLPVSLWAKPDCVLFLWMHNSMIPDGIELAKAWGFSYKARGFTWEKCYKGSEDSGRDGLNTGRIIKCRPVFGQGKWTRLSTELCFIFTRGNPRVMSHKVSELIVTDRREHSRKPDEIYERIEKIVDGPYLELFGSKESRHCKNWTRWIGKDRADVRRWASNSYPEEGNYDRSIST